MTLKADLFFSFRSPYSYLAVGRYRAMSEEYDLDITLRTVWPIAIRDPDILFTGNPAAPRYIVLDSMRAAAFLGLPVAQKGRPIQVVAEQPIAVSEGLRGRHRACGARSKQAGSHGQEEETAHERSRIALCKMQR